MWHDLLTNRRGRAIQEFFMGNQLFLMNDESNFTAFESRNGKSNIDLTIVNNQLLSIVQDWKISEEESCSDHRIITFNIVHGNYDITEFQYQGL